MTSRQEILDEIIYCKKDYQQADKKPTLTNDGRDKSKV